MNIITKLVTDAIVRMLRILGKLSNPYPKKLQDKRREDFKKQIDKHNKGK